MRSSVNIGSDHCLVLGKIRVDINDNHRNKAPKFETKINIEKLQEIQRQTEQCRLKQSIEQQRITQEEDIEISWENLTPIQKQ